MDLVTWLRQQLDEDEEVAGDAAGPGASRRRWMREGISCVVDATDNGLIVYGEGTPTPEQADHITRHDPSRAQAEVDAKRRILGLHDRSHECSVIDRGTINGEPYEDVDNCAWVLDGDDCSTVRLLALPYADRPGYRQEWAP